MKILLSGAAGFLGTYIVKELVHAGHDVIGIDNYARYGKKRRARYENPHYRFVEGDAKDVSLLIKLLPGVEHLIANAALHGGVRYLNTIPFDILAENSRLTAAAFDAALEGNRCGWVRRIHVIGSASVFENAGSWPVAEGDQLRWPPPNTSYGLQKLATEYFARSAWDQHGLPYTIIRPANCVGPLPVALNGAGPLWQLLHRPGMENVVIDLICKALGCRGTGDSLHLIGDGKQMRQFTHVADVATGIRLCVERNEAINQDFNLVANEPITIRELAQLIWERVNPGRPIQFHFEKSPKRDVSLPHVDSTKAARLLGFQPTITLPQMVNEMVNWVELLAEFGQAAIV